MKRDEYVRTIFNLLGPDPEKVRDANRRLFKEVVNGEDKSANPDLVLADIEDRLHRTTVPRPT